MPRRGREGRFPPLPLFSSGHEKRAERPQGEIADKDERERVRGGEGGKLQLLLVPCADVRRKEGKEGKGDLFYGTTKHWLFRRKERKEEKIPRLARKLASTLQTRSKSRILEFGNLFQIQFRYKYGTNIRSSTYSS